MTALYIALAIVAVMVAVILYCRKNKKEEIKPDSNGVAIINPASNEEGKKEERISQKVNEL